MYCGREFHLSHLDFIIRVASLVAVEANGTGLPSKLCPMGLGGGVSGLSMTRPHNDTQ